MSDHICRCCGQPLTGAPARIELDPDFLMARVRDKSVVLTPALYALLALLTAHRRPVYRDWLCEQLGLSDITLRKRVVRLRQRLAPLGVTIGGDGRNVPENGDAFYFVEIAGAAPAAPRRAAGRAAVVCVG